MYYIKKGISALCVCKYEIRVAPCIFSATYWYFVEVAYFQKQPSYFLLHLGHFLLFLVFMDNSLLKLVIVV